MSASVIVNGSLQSLSLRKKICFYSGGIREGRGCMSMARSKGGTGPSPGEGGSGPTSSEHSNHPDAIPDATRVTYALPAEAW